MYLHKILVTRKI